MNSMNKELSEDNNEAKGNCSNPSEDSNSKIIKRESNLSSNKGRIFFQVIPHR